MAVIPHRHYEGTSVTTHQIVFLLLDLSLIVIAARVLGTLARRFHYPAVIGEVLAGILLGPTLLGSTFTTAVFPTDVRPFLTALANVGVALFMFVIGLELNTRLLREQGRIATTVSVSSIVLPFGLGSLLALVLVRNHPAENRLGFVLFIGAAVSVTAFPVLARILTDRKLIGTTLGGMALTCAAVDDVLAWSLLAVVILVSSGGVAPWLFLLLPVYLAAMFLVVQPVLRRILSAQPRAAMGQRAVLIAGVLVSAAATELIGLHFIFGAFLFGLVLRRAGTEQLRVSITDRIEEFNSVVLLPVFFIVAGLKVQLSGIGLRGAGELALVLLVAVAGKFGGAYLGARLHHLPRRESAALGTLMNTRGLTELIILSVGLSLGILDQSLYSIMVVMAVVTTAMAGPLLRWIYPPAHLVAALAEQENAPAALPAGRSPA
jgi:Kef-type K+ transport system membrane component KefB